MIRDTFEERLEVHPGNPLTTFLGHDESAIPLCVHEKVFSQNGRAYRFFEDREVRLLVGIAVGRIGSNLPFRECRYRMPVDDIGVVVGSCLSSGGPSLPAATTTCIRVYREEQTIRCPVLITDLVDTVRANIERNVGELRDNQIERRPSATEHPGDTASNIPIELVLEELRVVRPYGRAFPGSILAMTVIDKDAKRHGGYLFGSRIESDAVMAAP